jgi:hypothetical protein
MPILSVTTEFTGQVGVNPRLVRILSNDVYSTVTADNYLQPLLTEGYTFYPTDYFFIMYGTSVNTAAIFTANITRTGTSTDITLVPYIPPGVPIVTGETVVNDIASFNNMTGGITDSGISKNALATYTGATIVGDFPLFNNTTGQLINSGIVPSAPSKPIVASLNGATVANDVSVFSDIKGTIADSGVAISALQLSANIKANSFAFGGGSTTTTFSLPGATTNTLVSAWIITASNASIVNSTKVLTPGTVTVSFTADPGTGTTVGYIAFIAPQ